MSGADRQRTSVPQEPHARNRALQAAAPQRTEPLADLQASAGNHAVAGELAAGSCQCAPGGTCACDRATSGSGPLQRESEPGPGEVAEAPVSHPSVEVDLEFEPIEAAGEALSLKGLTTARPTAKGSTFDHKTTRHADGSETTLAKVKVAFASNVLIEVDQLPTGLSPCQQKNADAGKAKLDAHEAQHAAIFQKFDGSAVLPEQVSITLAKGEKWESVANPIIDAATAAAVTTRLAPLQTQSDALDPPGGFVVDVDLDKGCPPAKVEAEEPPES